MKRINFITIIPILMAAISLMIANTSHAAGIPLTITSAIEAGTSEESAKKVADFYKEQDAPALIDMEDNGGAVLLTEGTIIIVDVHGQHNGFTPIHIKGKSQTLYLDADGFRTSTDLNSH
jgi:hypothetical protein